MGMKNILGPVGNLLFGGSDNSPKVPPLPPAAARPPKPTDNAVKMAQAEQRRRAAMTGGKTALTAGGTSGLNTPASTAKKTALGY